jgi:hypothetical protein
MKPYVKITAIKAVCGSSVDDADKTIFQESMTFA